MKWTKKTPTKPGWYFWRAADNFRVFWVGPRYGGDRHLGYGVEKNSAYLVFGTPGEEWAGPISEPEEPEDE